MKSQASLGTLTYGKLFREERLGFSIAEGDVGGIVVEEPLEEGPFSGDELVRIGEAEVADDATIQSVMALLERAGRPVALYFRGGGVRAPRRGKPPLPSRFSGGGASPTLVSRDERHCEAAARRGCPPLRRLRGGRKTGNSVAYIAERPPTATYESG